MLRDLRFALRHWCRSPGFAAVAIISLALAIGAATAIFSAVYAVVLAPLPYRHPGRLLAIQTRNPFYSLVGGLSADGDFAAWQKQATAFASLGAAGADAQLVLTGRGPAQRVAAMGLSPQLLSTLGVQPFLGRGFVAADFIKGARREVLISYGFWRQHFGGDRAAVGQSLILDGHSCRIAGVLPRGFDFPEKFSPALWTPLVLDTSRWSHMDWDLFAVGRLRPGANQAQAQAQITAIESRIARQQGGMIRNETAFVLPLKTLVIGHSRSLLWLLFGAVAFLLLIACANVANLLLARASARRREIAIRSALGAPRRRIARQLLTESVLLGVCGAGLGLLIAWAGRGSLVRLLSSGDSSFPRVHAIGLHPAVLVFAAALALAAGVLFGLAPALDLARAPRQALQEGSLTISGDRRGRRLRRALVVGEIALALVLAVGGGLLFRSLMRLGRVNPGFHAQGLLALGVNLPPAYAQAAQKISYFQRALTRLRRLPGVAAAAVSAELPFSRVMVSNVSIPGRPKGGAVPTADESIVGPQYFRVMGIPLLAGRSFTAADKAPSGAKSPGVAIVDRKMAQTFWPGRNPLGQKFNGATVIGVVGHVLDMSLAQHGGPEYYLPAASGHFLLVRTPLSPAAIAPQVRRAVQALDPGAAISEQTMRQAIGDSVAGPRLRSLLFGLFAGLAVVLAALGIYGVISYSVAQRTHELGLRLALGAQGRDLLAMVVREALLLAATGVFIGLFAAWGLTRLLAVWLFGVGATDPATFIAAAAGIGLIGLFASWLPARRAARVAPAIALRVE